MSRIINSEIHATDPEGSILGLLEPDPVPS